MTKRVLVAKGEYEVFIEKVEIKKFDTGSTGLKLQLRIRKDVEQRFSNWVVFDTIFFTKASEWKKDKLFVATGLKETEKDELKTTLNELPELLLNKEVRIKVEHRDNTYKGKTTTQATVVNYEKPTIVEVEKEEVEELLFNEIDFDEEIVL